ncbi:hypothetical protein E2320_009512, partial [Naja naja]
MYHLWS